MDVREQTAPHVHVALDELPAAVVIHETTEDARGVGVRDEEVASLVGPETQLRHVKN